MARDDVTDIRYFDLCNTQVMMWFDAQVSQRNGYLLGAWFKTDQPMDAGLLREAFARLTRNHDALRLRIDTDTPRQWISHSDVPRFSVFDIDTDDPDAAIEAQKTRHVRSADAVWRPAALAG